MFYSLFVPFRIMEFLMERRLLWFLIVSCEFALFQLPCAFPTIPINQERKRIRKCRGGRRKIRKIKVFARPRHQNHYSGQIGYSTENLIEINIFNYLSSKSTCTESFRICLFNAWSVGTDEKQTKIKEFVTDQAINILFLTETWLKLSDDEIKCTNLTPSGYTVSSFTCNNRGGGIAMLAKNSVVHLITYTSKFTFNHTSFELVHATVELNNQTVNFFCIYRPSPQNKPFHFVS